jgi:hypothetical protein
VEFNATAEESHFGGKKEKRQKQGQRGTRWSKLGQCLTSRWWESNMHSIETGLFLNFELFLPSDIGYGP